MRLPCAGTSFMEIPALFAALFIHRGGNNMKRVEKRVRPDCRHKFPRCFVVGQKIYMTESGRFVMYSSNEMNLKEAGRRG